MGEFPSFEEWDKKRRKAEEDKKKEKRKEEEEKRKKDQELRRQHREKKDRRAKKKTAATVTRICSARKNLPCSADTKKPPMDEPHPTFIVNFLMERKLSLAISLRNAWNKQAKTKMIW